jgi:hypothetical protein
MADYTTLDDAGSFFNPVLYTGTGSSLAITGVGFQPDLTWIKGRSFVGSHKLTDAVRGVTKEVESSSSAAQNTEVNGLTAFGADGFTVGSNADYNTNTATLVSWNWKAGTTTGIDTTGSTITPSGYSFNATAKQSIIAYTGNGSAGALVPHGLGVTPDMIIVKNLDTAGPDWGVYHTSLGATKYLRLNTNEAVGTDTTLWNDTSPTSTLFSLGTSTKVNTSGDDYIAYCFANVQGYSRMRNYEGNNNANGTFVYTGFRPAWVLCKSEDSTSDWHLADNKRIGYNPDNEQLFPSTTAAENATQAMDLLSNGFKLRIVGDPNVAETFIYAAFAEAPFVNSSGVPVNAR